MLRKIIESTVSSPVEKYFKDKLFVPSGMSDTQLPRSGTPRQLKSSIENLALGFEYNVMEKTTKINSADNKIDFSKLDAAGGIISTVLDLVKWNDALYRGAIISNDIIKIMTKGHVNSAPYPFYYGLDNLYYGYGIDIYNENKKRCYQHSGGLPGYQSRLIYLPNINVTIVHLSNSQKDDSERKVILSYIVEENECDTITAEKIFAKQYP